MRRLSSIFRFMTFALFLFSMGNAAKANGTDPQVGLGGSGSCTETPFQETSLTQTFTGLQTGCINDFTNLINDSTVTLDTLVVNVTSAFSGTLTCVLFEGAPLNSATQSSATSCTFFDATQLASISPGQTYGLTFDTNFGSAVDITLAQTVITPEPTTMFLLGTGFVVLFARRKRLTGTKKSGLV